MDFYRQSGFLIFGSRLKRLGDMFINDVNKIYKAHHIAFDASWFPVFYLLSQKQELSIKEIAEDLKVSHSAVSQLLTNLQQKGLVKSAVSKTDARHKVITLTAKGEKLLQKIKPIWDALKLAMDELVTETPGSKQILSALKDIEDNILEQSIFERIEQHL